MVHEYTLSVDIGGSGVKAAVINVVGNGFEFVDSPQVVALASKEFDDLGKIVTGLVDNFVEQHSGGNLAISTTGSVSADGIVLNAGHFSNYRGVNWSDIVRSDHDSRIRNVAVYNDGKASTWAEYSRVRNEHGSFAHVVVGTGIGGGVVINDRLWLGEHGIAGAFGHIKVRDSGPVCSCRKRGCVEPLASTNAIIQYARDRGISVDSFAEAVMVAQNGDERARAAFSEAGSMLGTAISNVIAVANPATITVGGGVALASASIDADSSGGPYVEAVRARVKDLAFKRVADGTSIDMAGYGNDGGLIGAALLCNERA